MRGAGPASRTSRCTLGYPTRHLVRMTVRVAMDRTDTRTNVRFYPEGYIGLEQATLKIAKHLEPDTWDSEKFLCGENAFWSGLAIENSAVDISTQLWLSYKEYSPEEKYNVYGRIQSFLYARQQLQKWLFSGEIIGEYIDESGRWGWIQNDGWGTAAGLDILERGVGTLEDGWVRLVLLREARINELLHNMENVPDNNFNPGDESSYTSGEENRIVKQLAEILRAEPSISKAKAAERLGIAARSRPYELRIWPRGRKAAGLSERAPVGRKKSMH